MMPLPILCRCEGTRLVNRFAQGPYFRYLWNFITNASSVDPIFFFFFWKFFSSQVRSYLWKPELDNNHCALSFCSSHCEKKKAIIWADVFFLRKQWCIVITVIKNHYSDISVCTTRRFCLIKNVIKHIYFVHLCTHPFINISISPHRKWQTWCTDVCFFVP